MEAAKKVFVKDNSFWKVYHFRFHSSKVPGSTHILFGEWGKEVPLDVKLVRTSVLRTKNPPIDSSPQKWLLSQWAVRWFTAATPKLYASKNGLEKGALCYWHSKCRNLTMCNSKKHIHQVLKWPQKLQISWNWQAGKEKTTGRHSLAVRNIFEGTPWKMNILNLKTTQLKRNIFHPPSLLCSSR